MDVDKIIEELHRRINQYDHQIRRTALPDVPLIARRDELTNLLDVITVRTVVASK